MSVAGVGHSPTVINTNNDATLLNIATPLLHVIKTAIPIFYFNNMQSVQQNQSKEILSTLKKSDLQDASNGFEFMGKVFHWMEKDLSQQLPTGYAYTDALDFW